MIYFLAITVLFLLTEAWMDKVLFDQLNSIYFPMWNKANDVKNHLMSAG